MAGPVSQANPGGWHAGTLEFSISADARPRPVSSFRFFSFGRTAVRLRFEARQLLLSDHAVRAGYAAGAILAEAGKRRRRLTGRRAGRILSGRGTNLRQEDLMGQAVGSGDDESRMPVVKAIGAGAPFLAINLCSRGTTTNC
jgi:hypothetical protein